MFFSRTLKIFIIGILAFVFATVVTAFAASNTVPGTNAGDGSGAISGYTVSNIQYNLNAGDPGVIDSVTFDLNASANTVVIELDGAEYSCSVSGGTSVTCDTTSGSPTVAGASTLRVIAGDVVP